MAAIVFLRINDQDIDASEAELETLVLAVAKGQADKTAIAAFFRDHGP